MVENELQVPQEEVPPAPVIHTIAELAELPNGIGFGIHNEEDVLFKGTNEVGKILIDILTNDPSIKYIPSSWRELFNTPDILTGTIMCSLDNLLAVKVLQKLIERYPNICWLRGDGLKTTSGKQEIDRTTFITGADGYLGDLRALNYAWKNYNYQPRENPCLYVVKLVDLLVGRKNQAIFIGSHHRYDVTIASRSKPFTEWIANSLQVYMLPTEEEAQQNIVTMMNQKGITQS